jgi:plastocyanin
MSRRRRIVPIAALAAFFAVAAASPAHDGAHVEVDAAGNAFTGGLAFDPADIEVVVGEHVRWTNTDILVPHTATEDHDLWDLTGTYGATPLTPPGFGPGDSRERRFEAGSWSYYCRVHPVDMRGTVDVPVKLRKRKVKGAAGGTRYVVIARWAKEQLPDGQVFDVQKRALIARAIAGGKASARNRLGPWRSAREDTRSLKLAMRPLQAGSVVEFRARVHRADDPEAASGWSPRARITLG